MGKTNGENSDLKSKLNIVRGIIANAKKDLKSLKTDIKDVKNDYAKSKKDLNSLNNDFIEYLKESLKVSHNLIKIKNDILRTKNESYINIKNQYDVIKNDKLIVKAICITLKVRIRKNLNLLRNIKNNLYCVKKDIDSIQIDLKKLKKESICNINKRAKIRLLNIVRIKTYHLNKKMRAQVISIRNKASSKNNAACTSTDDLIVKKHVELCTNEKEPCTNEKEPCTNEKEPCTNEKEPCTNENENVDEDGDGDSDEDDSEDDDSDDEDDDSDDEDDEVGNNDNIVDEAGHNNSSKKLNIVAELKKCLLNNIQEIYTKINELNDNIYDGDSWLQFAQLNKINPLLDQLIDFIWIMFYHKKEKSMK